jgi:hypothetical protein
MKTTLRYLLSMIMVLSVLSLSAQTPKYGRIYNPGRQYASAQVEAQMPVATMSSTSSDLVSSGSSLPQAAVTGTTTTYDVPANTRLGQIRRVGEDDGFDDDDDDPENPANPFPLGDGLWALMLLACAYLGMRVFLIRKRA